MENIQVDTKEKLLEEIESLDERIDSVYINSRPSVEIVNKIIESVPGIRRIYCPPSLLKQTSTKAFEIAEKAGVELNKKDVPVGRPKKYSEGIIQEIRERRRQGIPVKEISQELKIPIRTVYYYLNKNSL